MNAPATIDRLSLGIEGMHCSACSTRLEGAFKETEGVAEASVNLPLESATLTFDPSKIDIDGIVDVVKTTGFAVATETQSFGIEGMHCAACANTAENALLESPGVLNASVNLALESCNVTFLKKVTGFDNLVTAIDRAGYSLVRSRNGDSSVDADPQKVKDRYRLIIACVIAVPFLIQMFSKWLGWEDIHLMPAAEIALSSILLWLAGPRFFKSALGALRRKSANMDVLVSLGTLSAYFFSWFLTIRMGEAAEGELYFEAAVLIMTLVLIGKHLESRAKHATTAAIRELLSIRPNTASIVLPDGETVERPIAQVKVGDVFEVQAGQIVAADGAVISGTAHIDESLVTGESTPVVKAEGNQVIEGALNVDGYLQISTTAIGADSTLQRIVQMIESAQVGKTGIQRLVDKVSSVFVPVVLVIAVWVIALWLMFDGDFETAFINGVTVLVIACPCALGLATPTAVMTGVGAAAKRGILFKDLAVLEAVRSTDTVVFDKTGTLTDTSLALKAVHTFRDIDEDVCLQIAASLQAKSTHPIATAFKRASAVSDLELYEVEQFKSVVGRGVEGLIENQRYHLGSFEFVHSLGIDSEIEKTQSDAVFLASNGDILAAFDIGEQIRDHASEVVTQLKANAVTTVLLSGDGEERVDALAQRLGIDESHSRFMPADKVEFIKRREGAGSKVAMVGDGINDAPALAAATVGIAMRSSTNVAMEVAPITLMHADLRLLVETIEVSKATFRKIKQNLFWAFIYNIVMLPLAGLGVLSPTIAGAAMALSSITVVLNSLWLKSWHPRHIKPTKI